MEITELVAEISPLEDIDTLLDRLGLGESMVITSVLKDDGTLLDCPCLGATELVTAIPVLKYGCVPLDCRFLGEVDDATECFSVISVLIDGRAPLDCLGLCGIGYAGTLLD